jgi:serine/threonine-protein kinase
LYNHRAVASDEPERPTRKEGPSDKPTAPGPHVEPDADKPDADRYLGQVVGGRYRVLKKLGAGGMGVVFQVQHTRIESMFALKILTASGARKHEHQERFAREAKAATRIGHENIVNVTDFGITADGAPFFVMEFLEGSDLGKVVRGKPMPIPRVAPIFYQLCRGLGAAHGKGIVHRDLKPDNVFLIDREHKNDFVKILDFGLARVISDEAHARGLTRKGAVFGTPEYMSPEQVRGDPADHRADVYAAGCVLYEMLTGDAPFTDVVLTNLLKKHLQDEPDPPSKRAPALGIPPELDAVVLKALAKDPDARFDTMKDLSLSMAAAMGDDLSLAWAERDGDGVPPGASGKQPGVARAAVTVPDLGRSRRSAAEPDTDTAAGASAADPPPGQQPRSRPTLVIGVALTLVAAVGTWWARGRSDPPAPAVAPVTPTIPAPAAPATPTVATPGAARPSRVTVRCTPDAEVLDGARRVGRTPLVMEVSPERPRFELSLTRAGHRPLSLSVSPDRDREYVLQLVPLKSSSSKPAPLVTLPQPQPQPLKPPPPRKTPELKGFDE